MYSRWKDWFPKVDDFLSSSQESRQLRIVKTSVADPKRFDSDPDPDPAKQMIRIRIRIKIRKS